MNCRVCNISHSNLISLKNADMEASADFTLKGSESVQPPFICTDCVSKLEVAYRFKNMYTDTTIRNIRSSAAVNQLDGRNNSIIDEVDVQSVCIVVKSEPSIIVIRSDPAESDEETFAGFAESEKNTPSTTKKKKRNKKNC